jgi:hypothetical protein
MFLLISIINFYYIINKFIILISGSHLFDTSAPFKVPLSVSNSVFLIIRSR